MPGQKARIARGALAMSLVAIASGFAGYSLHPKSSSPAAAPAIETKVDRLPVAIPQQPVAALDRAAFLDAAGRAASDFAVDPTRPLAASLVGRQFTVRMPFGCSGPTPAGLEAQAYWRDEPARKSITVGARAQSWTDADWRSALDPKDLAETIEGFWIPRPWILDSRCPSPDGAADTPEGLAGAVGLARLSGSTAPRTERRSNRPYEVTRPAPTNGATPGPFVLVLTGRISGFEDGAAFRCLPAARQQRPACLAAVELASVKLETLENRELIAEWQN